MYQLETRCARIMFYVISSRRYTPLAPLSGRTYAYSPCVLSSLFRSRFILSFSCGCYAVSSVSVSAATRLAYDVYDYLDAYVRGCHLFICLSDDLFQLSVVSSVFICFPPEAIIRSRAIGACPVTTDCIEAMS